MRNGISGQPCPPVFPYSDTFNKLGQVRNVSPNLCAAIKYNETGLGMNPSIVSPDGGHGLMQLTSSYPANWQDPTANIDFAIVHFIAPAWLYWAEQGFSGDDLVRLIAASYNAGINGAEQGHLEGDTDKYTTDRYGERALQAYYQLCAGKIPTG